MNDPVKSDELLSRFLVERKNKFSVENALVKQKAFEPNRKGLTSVFRISGWGSEEIKKAGEKVAADQDKTLYGYGELTVSEVTELELSVRPSEPPPRHADIVGWPSKERRLFLTQSLSSVARLRLY